MRYLLLGVWIPCVLAQSEGAASLKMPEFTAEDLARGERLFGGHCAPCHGPAGDGGKGSNLARPRLPRAADDAALFRVIKNGISGTQMPGAWQMIDSEIWQVAAHVRKLGANPPEPLPGDPARGEQVYRGKGNCASCHMIQGKGGRMGPELTDVGASRSVAYLKRSLLEPAADLPDDFLMVTAVARDGRKLEGVLLNEDTFSIQVRDLTDRFHSFWKTELKDVQKDHKKSPMPSYSGTLTPSEIDDVVAYLSSLRGGL